MSYSPEFKLILAILNNHDVTFEHEIDQDKLYTLAMRHRIYPLMDKYLAVSPNLKMANMIRHNKLKNLQLIAETARLNKIFRAQNITLVFIKGVVLAHTLYHDVSLRPCKDIDFVVDKNNILQTITILENEGYELKHPEFELTPRRLEYFIDNKIEFVFVHKVSKICVEPHWGLNYFSNSKLNYQTKESIFFNQQITTLSDIDNFIYLSMHGATHCFWRIRWLNDLALLVRNGIDLEQVCVYAHKQNVLPIIHMVLILLKQLFEINYSSEINNQINKDKKASRLAKIAMKYIVSEDYAFDGNVRHPLFYLYRIYLYYLCPTLLDALKQAKMDIFKLDNTIRDLDLADKYWYLYYILHPVYFIKRVIYQ